MSVLFKFEAQLVVYNVSCTAAAAYTKDNRHIFYRLTVARGQTRQARQAARTSSDFSRLWAA